MIRSSKIGKEILVTVVNKIGVLANISKILADHGINIEGLAGYSVNNEAKIMLVADDTLRAVEVLRKSGYQNSKKNDVLIVELDNKPGALKGLTAKLMDGKIDIKYTYGTACPEGCPARIILSTSDNEKAIVLFSKK